MFKLQNGNTKEHNAIRFGVGFFASFLYGFTQRKPAGFVGIYPGIWTLFSVEASFALCSSNSISNCLYKTDAPVNS